VLPRENHNRMALRSYVTPSSATTGSEKRENDNGHTSESSTLMCACVYDRWFGFLVVRKVMSQVKKWATQSEKK